MTFPNTTRLVFQNVFRAKTFLKRAVMSRPVPECLLKEMNIPPRQLYGPGPSNMTEPIAHSQSRSLLGHLHPEFVKIMSEVKEGLQYVFRTKNAYTFAVSGTGHAGMECALLNLLEQGDRFLVVQIGLWGQRAADLGKRMGAEVKVIEEQHGKAMELHQIREALLEYNPHVIFVCHGESSTGVCQSLDGLAEICKQTNTLLLVDTVASLGGAPFDMDSMGIDCVYSATQKVLNAPPGLAPISFSEKAMAKVHNRKVRVPSFYFDALELGNYWGCDEKPIRYHHTAPISTVYALREALSVVAKEGIDQSIERHRQNAAILYKKLEDAGLQCFVPNPEHRLPCLTTVKVPEGVNWKEVADDLLSQGVEIAGGLGATAGKIWRIGTFGGNSDNEKMTRVADMLIAAVKMRNAHL